MAEVVGISDNLVIMEFKDTDTLQYIRTRMQEVRRAVKERKGNFDPTDYDFLAILHPPISVSIPVERITYKKVTISDLPNEILEKIFYLIAHDPDVVRIPDNFRWIGISHVCRRWRSVALNFPALWSRIPIKNRWWRLTTLVRSKTSPLIINVTPRLSKSLFVSRTFDLFKELYRMKCLHLHVPVLTLLSIIRQKLNQPAPMLESLAISFSGSDQSYIFRIPDTIFAGTAPRLRTLKLGNCALAWSNLPLFCRGLTQLVLTEMIYDIRPTMAELLSVLDASPLLETLCLRDVLHPMFSESNVIVELDHLIVLDVQDDCDPSSYLLDHLNFREQDLMIFNLAVHTKSQGSISLKWALDTMSRFNEPQGIYTHQHSTVEYLTPGPPQLRWRSWSSLTPVPIEDSFRSRAPQFCRRLEFSLESLSRFSVDIIFPFLHTVLPSYNHSIALVFHGGVEQDALEWIDILQGVNITALHLRDNMDILDVMEEETSFWSTLKYLKFEDHDQDIPIAILDSLIARIVGGMVLEKVVVTNCGGFCQDAIKKLRAMTTDFSWDQENEDDIGDTGVNKSGDLTPERGVTDEWLIHDDELMPPLVHFPRTIWLNDNIDIDEESSDWHPYNSI